MAQPTHDAGTHQHGRHEGQPPSTLQAAVDRIANVVTADLLVDVGVLLTGIILILIELGYIDRGH
jgi:hypothetical protein